MSSQLLNSLQETTQLTHPPQDSRQRAKQFVPEPGTPEAGLTAIFLKPQDWIN
jgi:hypothetical protein